MALLCDRGIGVMLNSLEWAKMTNVATANVRLVAFLVDLMRRDQGRMSQTILSGCLVVGGPIRDIGRWIRGLDGESRGIRGKPPDDIDLSANPQSFQWLGDDFMVQICDHIVQILNGQTLLGIKVEAAWSGPDSGTYKINIQWGEFRGADQIIIDLSQFKEEKDGKIVLNASIQADAFRRDLTLNALYCSLEVFFDGVDSSAPEIPMWFSLLRTMREAFLSGNIMDPTGSGLWTLEGDLMDLCGVREALLLRASEMGLGDLSGIPDTGVVREALCYGDVAVDRLIDLEDKALGIIFDDNNFIRAFRLLRDVMKGCSMPPWLLAAVERWVEQFVRTKYTDAEIVRKASVLEMKLSVLAQSVKGVPEWAIRLFRFFFQRPVKGKATDVDITRDLMMSLLRDKGATIESITSWMSLFPKEFKRMFPEEALCFILDSIKVGRTFGEALAFWKIPALQGSVCEPGDQDFQTYEDQLKEDLASGKLKGKITDARVQTFVKSIVLTKYRDTVLRLYLEAGASRVVTVSGTVIDPVFSLVDNKSK